MSDLNQVTDGIDKMEITHEREKSTTNKPFKLIGVKQKKTPVVEPFPEPTQQPEELVNPQWNGISDDAPVVVQLGDTKPKDIDEELMKFIPHNMLAANYFWTKKPMYLLDVYLKGILLYDKDPYKKLREIVRFALHDKDTLEPLEMNDISEKWTKLLYDITQDIGQCGYMMNDLVQFQTVMTESNYKMELTYPNDTKIIVSVDEDGQKEIENLKAELQKLMDDTEEEKTKVERWVHIIRRRGKAIHLKQQSQK